MGKAAETGEELLKVAPGWYWGTGAGMQAVWSSAIQICDGAIQMCDPDLRCWAKAAVLHW